MSKREDIATNIVSVVSGVSSPAIKKVSRQPFPLDELSQQQYPAVLVQTQSEEKEGAIMAILSLPDLAKSATSSTVAGPTHFSGPNFD